jgi:Dock homology region 2
MEATNEKFRKVMEDNDTNTLIMTLNGVLNAAVNGGFKKYEVAFLSGDYIEKNPNDVHLSKRLLEVKNEQDSLIKDGQFWTRNN